MNNKPTLLELKQIESEMYKEVQRIENDVLEPARIKWRIAYRNVINAEDEAKIDAEVQRRLAEKEAT